MIPEWPEISMVVSRIAVVPREYGPPFHSGDYEINLFQCDTAAIRGATKLNGIDVATIYVFPMSWARYTDEDLKFKAELMIRYRLSSFHRCYEMREG